MPFDSAVPKIKDGTINAVLRELQGPGKNPNWMIDTFNRICVHDPIMAAYLKSIEDKYGIECATAALLVYRIIESQIEADQMDQDFE